MTWSSFQLPIHWKWIKHFSLTPLCLSFYQSSIVRLLNTSNRYCKILAKKAKPLVNLNIICTCWHQIWWRRKQEDEVLNYQAIWLFLLAEGPFTAIFLSISVSIKSLHWFCEASPVGNDSNLIQQNCCNMALPGWPHWGYCHMASGK